MKQYLVILVLFVFLQVGIYFATREDITHRDPVSNTELHLSEVRTQRAHENRKQEEPLFIDIPPEPKIPIPHPEPKKYNLYPKPPTKYTCAAEPPAYIQNHTSLYCIEYDAHPQHLQQIPKERDQLFWFSDTCEPTLEYDAISEEYYWKSYSKCTYYMPEPADETVPPEGEWLCFPKVISFSPPRAGTTTFWDVITDNPLFVKSNYNFKEPNWWGGWAQNSKFVGPDGFISYLKSLCPAGDMVPAKDGAEAIERAKRLGTVPTYCSEMICGDWSTWYSYRNPKEVVQRVRKTLPDAITVVHLRDPVFRQQSYTNLPGAIPPKDQIPDGEAYAQYMDRTFANIKENVFRYHKYLEEMDNGDPYFPLQDIDLVRKHPELTLGALMGGWGRMGIGLYWVLFEAMLGEYTLNQNLYVSMLDELVADRQQFAEEVWRYLGAKRYYSDWNSLKVAGSHLHDSSTDIKSPLKFPTHLIDKLHEFYRPHDLHALHLLGWPEEKFPWLMK